MIILTVSLSFFIRENAEPVTIMYITIPRKKKRQLMLKTLCVLPCLILSALRYDVGTDYFPTYYDGFLRVMSGSNYDHFDIGYRFLNILMGKISDDPQIIFIITSVLFCTLTLFAIYNLSVDIPFSVYLLFVTRYYFISLNVIRQLVAMAIVLYALKYLFKGEKKKYLILIIIASLIHYMVAMSVVFLFLDKWKLNNDRMIIAFVLMIGLFGLSKFHIIESVVQGILKGTRYSRHFDNNGLYTGEKFAAFTFVFNMLLLLLFYMNGKKNMEHPKYNLYLNSQLIATALCTLMTSVHLVERVYYIFGFLQIVSIPYMISLFINKENRIFFKLIIVIFFSIYCFWDIFLKFNHQVVPYHSVLSKV